MNTIECTEESNVIEVTVNNFVPGVVAADQTICEGDDVVAFTSTTPASGDGAITYQWQSSTTSAVAGFSDISGATSATFDEGTISQDTWYKRLATSTLNTIECTEESNVIEVTVNNFVPGVVAADQTICEGDDVVAFTSTTPASGDGAITYQWQSSTTSAVAGFSDISGATSATFDEGTISQDTWYKRLATSTLNTIECTEESNVIEVTVNNFVPGVVAADQTICEGDDVVAFTSTTPASGDGAITYQWQSSTTSAVAGFSDISGATSATFDEGTISQDTWYKRLATSTLGTIDVLKRAT